MIRERTGNLLTSSCEALVIPVNTAGAMGAGLALTAKKQFPEIWTPYRKACGNLLLRPGLPVWVPLIQSPQRAVLFPTKRHWKETSRLEDIDAGLQTLRTQISTYQPKGIALPLLGCGLGMLPPSDVVALIYRYLSDLPVLCDLYRDSTPIPAA